MRIPQAVPFIISASYPHAKLARNELRLTPFSSGQRYVTAFVTGIQGSDSGSKYIKAGACLKHYAALVPCVAPAPAAVPWLLFAKRIGIGCMYYPMFRELAGSRRRYP